MTHTHARANIFVARGMTGYLCKRTTELDGLAAAWAAVCFVAGVLQSQLSLCLLSSPSILTIFGS